jgi:hypothetical protein
MFSPSRKNIDWGCLRTRCWGYLDINRRKQQEGTGTAVYVKPESKGPLGRPWLRWEDKIKVDIKETGCDALGWIHLVQVREHWRTTSNTVIKFLTPRNRVLETPIVTHLVKKFPAFYGTWRFITMFTTTRLWSLSWARCIQSTLIRSISVRAVLMVINLRVQ